jgi:hypothetical protein
MIGLTRGSHGGCVGKLMRTYSAGRGGGPEEKIAAGELYVASRESADKMSRSEQEFQDYYYMKSPIVKICAWQ